MAIKRNYAIWNNKGGVGKSTITFHIASRYAETHPDEDVLVIDMCPQANVSMMLLGGGTTGEDIVIKQCQMQSPQTVVGYITESIVAGQNSVPDSIRFAIRPCTSNDNMPQNLYLLCGDGNLEIIAPELSRRADEPRMTANQEWPWVRVHSIIRNYITDFAQQRAEKSRNVAIFIDTNPAFSIYTELAIVAADKLICPVNADDSSKTATSAMAILLYGSNPPHPIYGSWTFAAKAQEYKVNIPRIHLLIGNRMAQYGGTATAYAAMSQETAKQMFGLYQQHPDYFSPMSTNINSIGDFIQVYSVYLRDFNTAGVVASHTGCLLSNMGGKCNVYGKDVQLNKDRIQECLKAVDDVIAKL